MRQDPIFIAGVGRSGSTLLEAILSVDPANLCVGELRYIWERGYRENWLCPNGEAFHDSEFWVAAMTRFMETEARSPETLEQEFRTALGRKFKVWLECLRPGRDADNAFRRFAETYHAIYTSIEAVASGRRIVDSSKNSICVNLLTLPYPGAGRLKIIHLVRDPVAVTYSRRTAKPNPGSVSRPTMKTEGTWKMILRWNWQNITALWAQRHAAGYVAIRYADLCAEPYATIGRIYQALDLGDVPEVYLELERKVFQPGEMNGFSGNPSRMAGGKITLSEDTKWRSSMSRPLVWVVRTMTAPVHLMIERVVLSRDAQST